MSAEPVPPFDDGAEALIHHLWRHYGSHETPTVLYEWYCGGLVAPGDLVRLVREVWVGRNERMPGDILPDEWEELFDACNYEPPDLELPVTLYRAGYPDGMSWTTDRAVAERFAMSGRSVHRITLEDWSDVLTHFGDERHEAEVVLRPGSGSRVTTVSRATPAIT